MTTPASLHSQQAALVHEASLALPGEFSTCTHDLGYIKQAVYLCLTCAEPRGICTACSIACHGDHEQIELFPKRHFCCDCPTSSLPHLCTLKTPTQPPNTENTYGQNFERGGRFCRCSQTYDVRTERETMVQCLACQDWFHESCLNLRERVPPRQLDDVPTIDAALPEHESHPTRQDSQAGQIHPEATDDDASSTVSDPSLPPALIPGTTYDTLICGDCVLKNPTVKRYAGTPGVRMLELGEGGAYRVIGGEPEEELVDLSSVDHTQEAKPPAEVESASGKKRRLSHEASLPNKRARASPDPSTSAQPKAGDAGCIAPAVNPVGQAILDRIQATTASEAGPKLYGDIFLSDGWRDRWCRCAECDPPLLANPFLLEEEETYEPPKDPDAGLSLEELGMRALATLPHERALDSIRAYNSLRDDLMLYLRPFAESGREVGEADITAFFEQRRKK